MYYFEKYRNANPDIDVLVSGEGETIFRDYLCAELDGGVLQKVDALVYRDEEGLHFTTAARRVKDFRQTASPYLDGTFDRLISAHPGHFTMGMLETNRGCPFTCTFCDWSQNLTKKVKRRKHNWKDELLYFKDIDVQIRETDANFGQWDQDLEIFCLL